MLTDHSVAVEKGSVRSSIMEANLISIVMHSN